MTTPDYPQLCILRPGRMLYAVFLLMIVCAACREEVMHTAPVELPGTTWKFDDFYITFVSESELNVHGENVQDLLAQGTYSIIDEFIEVAIEDRVRAGSWDGERLMIDGMVGRLTKTAPH